MPFEHFVGSTAYERAQRFAPGAIGRVDVFIRAAEQHQRAVGVHRARQFRNEARLPDAGLPRDHHDPAITGGGGLPLRLQLLERGVTPGKRQLAFVGRERTR